MEMWLLFRFGDRNNMMISVNTWPHEEISYLLERHYLYEFNVILMGQNYKHLTKLHPSQVCHIYKSWECGS